MHRWKAVRGWWGWSKSSNRILFRCFVISSKIHQGASNQYRLYFSFVLVFFPLYGKTGSTVRPFWCVPQSFRHGRWIIYKGISFFMYSQALLGESYIRRFYFVLGSHKARLPRMQLLRQFLLRILILSFFFMHALGQNSVQTFGWKFRTDVSIPLPWTLQCIWSLTRSLVSVG